MPCSRYTHKPATATTNTATSSIYRRVTTRLIEIPCTRQTFNNRDGKARMVDNAIEFRSGLQDMAGLGTRATTGMVRVVERWYSAYCGYRWA